MRCRLTHLAKAISGIEGAARTDSATRSRHSGIQSDFRAGMGVSYHGNKFERICHCERSEAILSPETQEWMLLALLLAMKDTQNQGIIAI